MGVVAVLAMSLLGCKSAAKSLLRTTARVVAVKAVAANRADVAQAAPASTGSCYEAKPACIEGKPTCACDVINNCYWTCQ